MNIGTHLTHFPLSIRLSRTRGLAGLVGLGGALFLGLAGCDTSSGGTHAVAQAPLAPLVIAGTHLDPNGQSTTITRTTWNDPTGLYHIATYSNSGFFVIAQNDGANAANPGLWSRFDWTTYQGDLYACHTDGSAASEAAAAATPAANAANPATGGCAGGAWNHLAGPLAIGGTYVDQFGTTQTLTSSTWSDGFGDVFHIAEFSNAAGSAIAQNDAANAFFPSLWSRFDWTTYQTHLYYCQTAYNATSQAAAEATAPANATNPSVAGCGGFAWTALN